MWGIYFIKPPTIIPAAIAKPPMTTIRIPRFKTLTRFALPPSKPRIKSETSETETEILKGEVIDWVR